MSKKGIWNKLCKYYVYARNQTEIRYKHDGDNRVTIRVGLRIYDLNITLKRKWLNKYANQRPDVCDL